MKKILFILLAITGCVFTSCENQDWEFPDFEYTTVYFAYQTPVRTITFGEDVWDTSLDNQGQCQIMATIGGVYSNDKDRTISFQVDNSIVDDITFADGSEIKAMPSNYYTLSDNSKIVIPKGKLLGGVTVTLTDAFFADPEATTGKYVIPVRMTGVQGADSILSGVPLTETPRLAVAADWDVQPKNYVLYAVKYINQYDSWYLREGTDVYSDDRGKVERKFDYIEHAQQVKSFSTLDKNSLIWDFELKDADGIERDCDLKLVFDASGNVTISSLTEGIEASGNGTYTVLGEKNSWGGKDRDVMNLSYNIAWPALPYDVYTPNLEGHRVQNGVAKMEPVAVANGYQLLLTNETAGENPWDAQLFINTVAPMEAGATYTFSCDVKGSTAYNAGAFLCSSATGQQYYWPVPTFNFTEEWTTISSSFAPNATDADQIIINFGQFEGTITIDNMKLVKEGTDENILVNGTFDVLETKYHPEGTLQVTDKLVQWSRGVASEWFEVAAK